MDIKQAFVDSVIEILPMFGMNSTYIKEKEETALTSADQVNVLIGFTEGVRGNMIVAFKKPAAMKIASAMMGGTELDDLDEMAASAVGEMANMIAGYAIGKLQSGPLINLSPPTLALGEKMFLMISRIKTTKLFFQFGEETFSLSFCLEQ